jgi:hypothetical protein
MSLTSYKALRAKGVAVFLESDEVPISRLLLIRLFQEATICWGRGAFRAVLFAVP